MSLSFNSAFEAAQTLRPAVPLVCFYPLQIKRWVSFFKAHFSGCVLYAVKCNAHPVILNEIFLAGIKNFDVDSLEEVEKIKTQFPKADCFLMHPVKSREAIRSSLTHFGVTHFAVDHTNELKKITALNHSQKKVIWIRIATPNPGAVYPLSDKFGCSPEEAISLMQEVTHSGDVAGITFHVGSQNKNPAAFYQAIRLVHDLTVKAKLPLTHLNLGGGFPVSYRSEVYCLEDYFKMIHQGLTENGFSKINLYCEPGRALVAESCSVIVRVELRKKDRIFMNDGIYDHFMESATAHFEYPVRAIPAPGKTFVQQNAPFKVLGVSCDSFDQLPTTYPLPMNIDEGDWIEFKMMGAYSHLERVAEEQWVVIEENSG